MCPVLLTKRRNLLRKKKKKVMSSMDFLYQSSLTGTSLRAAPNNSYAILTNYHVSRRGSKGGSQGSQDPPLANI